MHATPQPQTLTQQALIGTVIALIGTWMYTEASARARKKPEAGSGGIKPAAA
jgi:diaminopimelate decarboxylase/solute carrier family 35 protein E1